MTPPAQASPATSGAFLCPGSIFRDQCGKPAARISAESHTGWSQAKKAWVDWEEIQPACFRHATHGLPYLVSTHPWVLDTGPGGWLIRAAAMT